MNKKELIERIEDFPCEASLVTEMIRINKNTLLGWVKELDEPQKVTVPQGIADYIKYAKENDWDLQDAMNLIVDEEDGSLSDWFYKGKNMELFARAWLDGFEVEEEKRYYVRFKWIEEAYSYLTLIKHLHTWTLYKITLDKKFRTEHTRKQLEEADFGWVFDCPGIEIVEVEE